MEWIKASNNGDVLSAGNPGIWCDELVDMCFSAELKYWQQINKKEV